MLIILLILFLGSLSLKILIKVMLIKKVLYIMLQIYCKEKSKSLWTNTLAKINKLHHKEISG